MDSLEESCRKTAVAIREGLERWLGCFTSGRKTTGLQSEAGTEHTDPTPARAMWLHWSKPEIEGKGHYPGQPVWFAGCHL